MKNIAFAFPMQLRTIAIVTSIALLAWTLGLPLMIQRADAANVSQFSDTISDSDLGADAAHRIEFTTTNGISPTDGDIVIEFDPLTTGFDFTGFTANDVSIVAGATGVPGVGSCGVPSDEMYPVIGADTVTLRMCTGHTIASSTTFVIDVGTTTGGQLINNPSTDDSYIIRISGAGNFGDDGDTRIAVIDDVTVTAAVDTIFSFSINGTGANLTVNDDVTQTFATSTATTVAFGVLAPGTPKLMAQELRVDTNALNGFSVTVFADQTLTAGNSATIDPFVDGVAVASTTQWQGPANTLGFPDTYGHWGITSDDNVVSSTTADLWGDNDAWYTGDFIQTPVEVFYHNAPVLNDSGPGVGSTTVAYKIEIENLQEAATDYTATLTYIATPVF